MPPPEIDDRLHGRARPALRLLRYFVGAYPGRSAVALACLITAALAEGLGIATMVPALALALRGEEGATAGVTTSGGEQMSAALEGALAAIGLPFTLMSVAAVLSVLLWFKAGMVLAAMRQVGNTVAFIATDLRLDILKHLFAARWSYFSRHPLGRLTNAIATESTRAADSYRQLALAAKYTTLSAVSIAVAMWLSWELATVALVGGGLVGVGLNVLVRLSRRAGQKQTLVINSLLSRLADALLNVKLLKTMRREDRIAPLIEADTERLQKALRKQVLAQEALNALQEPLIFMLLVGVVIVANTFALLPIEELTVVIFALVRALAGATKIQRRYQLAVTHEPALDSLRELVASAAADAEHLPPGAAPVLEHAIALRGVHFTYADRAVLEGVDLEIVAGQLTALVGGSGGGKSTITDLVTGLIRPDAGEVTIDGTSLAELDIAAWRGRIGYVPQELVLLHDSVRTNVTFGDPEISDAAVERALRAAGVWEVVRELPGGLDASVGERGTLLSGGQRARIALARALVCEPVLLVLDEATAALDPATEQVVLETIEQLRGQVTVLAISHQPALSRVADRIYRVDGGRATLVEQGQSIAS